MKAKVPLENRTSLLQMAEHFNGKIVHYGQETVMIRVAGTSDKLDAFLELVKTWEVIEVVRSGKIVMARGQAET